MLRSVRLGLLMPVLFALEGCSGGDLPTVPPPPPEGTVKPAETVPGVIPTKGGGMGKRSQAPGLKNDNPAN
jgi:hypothetical protein